MAAQTSQTLPFQPIQTLLLSLQRKQKLWESHHHPSKARRHCTCACAGTDSPPVKASFLPCLPCAPPFPTPSLSVTVTHSPRQVLPCSSEMCSNPFHQKSTFWFHSPFYDCPISACSLEARLLQRGGHAHRLQLLILHLIVTLWLDSTHPFSQCPRQGLQRPASTPMNQAVFSGSFYSASRLNPCS